MTENFLVRCNRDSVAAEVVDGEAIILNLETGAYYSLDQAGARIWQLLEHGLDTPAIAARVAEEYDAPAEAVASDVDALVADLLAEQLVIVDPAPVSEPSSMPSDTRTGAPRAYAPPALKKYTEMADMLALDPPLPGLKDLEWKRPTNE